MKRLSLVILMGLGLAACAPSAEWGPGLMHWKLTTTMPAHAPMSASAQDVQADDSQADSDQAVMDDQQAQDDQAVQDDQSVEDQSVMGTDSQEDNLLDPDYSIKDR